MFGLQVNYIQDCKQLANRIDGKPSRYQITILHMHALNAATKIHSLHVDSHRQLAHYTNINYHIHRPGIATTL